MLFNKLMELPSSVDEQKKLIRSALRSPTAQSSQTCIIYPTEYDMT